MQQHETLTSVLHGLIVQVLLHERDEFMARELRKQSGRVVAVVGMAHMDGIERWWDRMQTSQQAGHPM